MGSLGKTDGSRNHEWLFNILVCPKIMEIEKIVFGKMENIICDYKNRSEYMSGPFELIERRATLKMKPQITVKEQQLFQVTSQKLTCCKFFDDGDDLLGSVILKAEDVHPNGFKGDVPLTHCGRNGHAVI